MCYYSDHCVQSMFIHKLYTLILFLHYNCNIYLVVQFIVQIRHFNIILEKGDKPIIMTIAMGQSPFCKVFTMVSSSHYYK